MNHYTNERLARPQRGEPAGRGVRERAAAARLHTTEDRGAGALRRQALRHLQDPPGLQRLRLQDTRQVGARSCRFSSLKNIVEFFTPSLKYFVEFSF